MTTSDPHALEPFTLGADLHPACMNVTYEQLAGRGATASARRTASAANGMCRVEQ